MKVKIFTVNPFQMNSYLYYCENTKEGVIVDPGFYTIEEQESFKEFVKDNRIAIKYTLCTHGHIDHILGNGFVNNDFKTNTYLHKDDLFLYDNSEIQGAHYGLDFEILPQISNFIDERLELKVGNNKLNFIHTPGHSPGGISIVDHSEKIVFCGDLIFKNSIGRTDLPGGNYETLIKSIRNKLFNLCNNDYDLYTGHMEKTTIGIEKANNPYLN